MTDLTQRYGGSSTRRRPLVLALVALLAVAGLAWLAWVVAFHARPQVSSQLLGFDVAGQHAAEARFAVARRDADVDASCLLRAYSADHATVGELTLPVRGGAAHRTLTATLRTEREATTVELVGCTAPGQGQRR